MSSKHYMLNKSPDLGTIVLRNAEPKYNFVGRKLPKPEDLDLKENCNDLSQAQTRIQNSMIENFSTKKPVAVVEGSCQPTSLPVNSQSLQSPCPQSSNEEGKTGSLSSSCQVNKSVCISPTAAFPRVANDPFPLATNPLKLKSSSQSVKIEDTAAALALSNITNSLSLADRLTEIEREKEDVKKELQVQLQVNSELKRLLVASVGEDLGERVQRLVRDRAQLSFDIGGFSKKMREDYEHLDKVSIQADMWRSKYLASRVMIEELGNARAFYSLQCHDAQDALQQMLNERHELRTNLLDTYKVLQQVKGAFDPLNSHRSSSLASTNVLDLSQQCQQLAEAVRFRLLPAHVTTAPNVEIELDSWENSVTRAEQYAHELLSRPSQPPGSLQSGSSQLLPIAGTPNSCQNPTHLVNRFHPHVRHDNLTFTCCKCKGEISVI